MLWSVLFGLCKNPRNGTIEMKSYLLKESLGLEDVTFPLLFSFSVSFQI